MIDEVVIRPATLDDAVAALPLNEAAVPNVNSIAESTMVGFHETAPYFRVAVYGGRVVGFLIALDPGAQYDSPNFLFFKRKFQSFIYVDRIVVGDGARRKGVGNLLYNDLAMFSAGRFPLITCEVNTKPYNGPSLQFHRGLGFREVGTQQTDGGKKTVVLLVKQVVGG